MTPLKYQGFREKKVELRHITIAQLKLHIINRYVEKGEQEVQLIDLTAGETTFFRTIEEVLKNDWASNCEIEVLNMPHYYDGRLIIIFQEAPDWDEFRVIK